MKNKRIPTLLKKIQAYFEKKNEGCQGLFKFYFTLVLIVLVSTLMVTLIRLLGRNVFPGDHTLYMISSIFIIALTVIFLTPFTGYYKSTKEKFTAYAKAKRYIGASYKILLVEIVIRLFAQEESFWVHLYALMGFIAIILAFWFLISALVVYFMHHDIGYIHKSCYKKIVQFRLVKKPKG